MFALVLELIIFLIYNALNTKMKNYLLIVILTIIASTTTSKSFSRSENNPTAETRTESTLPFAEQYQYSGFVLENGLRLLVHEDMSAAGVTVAVYVHVGSKDEPQGKSGFAHLFEHLLFNGTKTNPGEYFKYLDEIGATGANGSTSWDYTNYFETVPREALERALWLEADRMAHIGDEVSQQSLKTQIDVVKNEKSLSDNEPFGRSEYAYLRTMYPAGHPYSHSVIGSVEDLESATLDDVKRWYSKYYGAQNTLVVLSGNVKTADAKALSEKYFSHLKPGPSLNKVREFPIKRSSNTLQVTHDIAPASKLVRSYPLPSIRSKQDALLPMAIEVFAMGENSFLHQFLVENQELAQDIQVFTENKELDTTTTIEITPKKGVGLAELSDALDKSIDAYLKKTPSKSDIERYVGGFRSYILEESSRSDYKALSMAEGYLLYGDPHYYLRWYDWSRNTKPSELKQVAQRAFSDGYHEQHHIAHTPRAASEPKFDLAVAPKVEKQAQVKLPQPNTFELSNGLKVVHLERASSPQIFMSYQVDRGTNYLAVEDSYIPELMTGLMLKEGVPGMNKETLLNQIQSHSIGLNAASGSDSTTLDLSVSKDDFDKGFDLWSTLLTQAQFKQKALDDMIESEIETLQKDAADIKTFAMQELFPTEVNGREATLSFADSIKSYQNADAKDLESLYRAWFKPNGATLYVVGNISEAKLSDALGKKIANWSGDLEPGKPVEVTLKEPPERPRFILMNDEGANQTVLTAVMHTPNLTGKDIYIEQLANAAIGGSFTSRLNMNLREDKGWSYGINAGIVSDQISSKLAIRSSVTGTKTVEAIKEITREIDEAVSIKPISNDEFEALRAAEQKSFPSNLVANQDLLAIFQKSDELGKPYDYFDQHVERLQSLTLDQVNQAAKELYSSSQPTWLLVGDLSLFEEQLRKEDLGDIDVYDMKGNRIR